MDYNFIETPGVPLSCRVADKRRLIVNPSLTLVTIPLKTFDYRLANRSAWDG